jgi:hypothetical protein
MYTILKMKAKTLAPAGAYLCTKPKLTDFYKMLGKSKLPLWPFKLFDN